jgi:hypothetical protein
MRSLDEPTGSMEASPPPPEDAMGFMQPTLPDIDEATWPQKRRLERIRELAPFWVDNGFGTQRVVHVLYAVKCVLYMAGAIVLTAWTTPGLGAVADFGGWWTEPIFFQKAVGYTILFEILGLGCGSGPLTLRVKPPIGGVLYWLRPGTVRLPPWPSRIPVTRGTTRTVVDVALYAGVLAAAVWILLAPGNGPIATRYLSTDTGVVDPVRLIPLIVLLPLLGLRDKTIFLAARSEHYFLTLLLFLFPVVPMLAAAQLVMLLLWWGAATSKLNRHFPFVVSIMISNAPLHMSKRLRRRLYRGYPDDLRPSRLSGLLAYGGTVTEYLGPLALVFSPNRTVTLVAVAVMVLFHLHILSTFPMGVPLEWNIFMIFSTLFLFGAHGDIGPAQIQSPWLLGLLAGAAAIVLLGNVFPHRISFLPAMRYYAGNWATSLWCFRSGAEAKLDAHVKKIAPSIRNQLVALYGEAGAEVILDIGGAWRAMHHHGRALNGLLPRALDDVGAYDIQEGEAVAGAVLGWNFGDGHLHDGQLLAAVQQRCGFAEGELRVIMLESQPIQRQRQHYRIVDAATGLLEEGYVEVAEMVARQPWLDEDETIPVTVVVHAEPRSEPTPQPLTPQAPSGQAVSARAPVAQAPTAGSPAAEPLPALPAPPVSSEPLPGLGTP